MSSAARGSRRPDPVDSTKMISAADHVLDEQDQSESDRCKDPLLREPAKNPALLLERLCEQFLDSLPQKWETGEGLNRRMAMEALEDLDNLPQVEIERPFKVETEHIYATNNVSSSMYVPEVVRKFYMSPKVDKHKPIQMEPDSGLARNKASPNTMVETKQPDITIMPPTILIGGNGFVQHSAYAKGNRVRKNISVISRAGNGSSSSEGTGSTLTGGNNHHRETDLACNDMPMVILDNQAQANCTGIFDVLSNLSIGPENIVLVAANDEEMETFMSGSVCLANFELHDVHYCPDLGNRIIVSGSMLDKDDYGYEFRQGKFTVKDVRNDTTVGEGRLVDGNYILDYLKIPRARTRAPEQPGLVTTLWNAVCSNLHRLGLKY